jgi:HlyD family secretion protein
MKMKKIWISFVAIIVLGSGAFFYLQSNSASEQDNTDPFVVAERGTVIEKALAVGTIEPENEIEIKSKISGVVNKIFAEPGDYVTEGQPLIEVRPDPTPLELAEAKRNLERTGIEKENLQRELARMEVLRERNLVSQQEFDQLEQRFQDAEVRVQINQERLELLESGRVAIGNMIIESVIRSPIDGFILEKMVDIGEPVVPLTSYQAGTPLMSIAGMERLLFKGNVDEIDVGKIEEGMPAEIKIGALPNIAVIGEVSRISLKARVEDNATVFPVEITITDTNGAVLRAGYSANADIIIELMDNAITIPERVITMREGRAFIEVQGDDQQQRIEREVELGLSDAITVAVTEGLEEGEKVLEKPVRKLTVR